MCGAIFSYLSDYDPEANKWNVRDIKKQLFLIKLGFFVF
jgi:hypothetical protein